MITNEMMFNDNTLNIFTDASIKAFPSGETVGCSGAHIVTGNDAVTRIIEQPRIIIRDTTNNNSEIKAIALGVQYALKYRAQFQTINIISDSKICVLGLREWIFNWIRDSKLNQPLVSSQKKEVANQEVFLGIIYTILNNNLNFNLYHQNGHINVNNSKDMIKAKNTFRISNHIVHDIDDVLMRNMSIANDIVDRFTKTELEHFSPEPDHIVATPLVEYFYDTIDAAKYRTLLNL